MNTAFGLRLAVLVAAFGSSLPLHGIQAFPTKEPIVIDGNLDEVSWRMATPFVDFTENLPREKQPASINTEARILFDERAIYVGIRAFDAAPEKIVAPVTRHDRLSTGHDTVSVWIDPTGSGQFAQIFKLSASGVTGDSLWNEASLRENISPDFDFDAVAMRTPAGWNAEFRIPWHSLRLPAVMERGINLIIFRNMLRDTRIRLSTAALGRDPPCFLCAAMPVDGLNIPKGYSLLRLIPYVAATNSRSNGGGTTSKESLFDSGFDLTWRPSSNAVLDATVHPDFSQLALDRPQLRSNTRFALSVSEKRAFFLEGADLFALPYASIYTRTATAPSFGARATYRSEAVDATVLSVRDRGGGYVVLPGAYGSDYKDQPASTATYALVRVPFKVFGAANSVGAALSDRRYVDGSTNQMASIDGVFKPADSIRIRGQVALSSTLDAGIRQAGRASYADAFFDDGRNYVSMRAQDVSSQFRADNSFIAQNGFRSARIEAYRCVKELSFLHEICSGFVAREKRSAENAVMERTANPTLYFGGDRNFELALRPRWFSFQRAYADGPLHRVPSTVAEFSVDPGGWLPRVAVDIDVGRAVDTFDDIVKKMRLIDVLVSLSISERIDVSVRASNQQLRDSAGVPSMRENAAQIVATLQMSAQDTFRLIAQTAATTRRPSVPSENVATTRADAASFVYTHRRAFGRTVDVGVTRIKSTNTDAATRSTFELFAKASWAIAL